MTEPIRVEKKRPVTTVIITRPDIRNTIDRETNSTLSKSTTIFEAFQ